MGVAPFPPKLFVRKESQNQTCQEPPTQRQHMGADDAGGGSGHNVVHRRQGRCEPQQSLR